MNYQTIKGAKTWEELDSLVEGDVQLVVSGLLTAGISQFFNDHYERFKSYLDKEVPIVSLSKGLTLKH